jgi:hypothetical protein
MYIPYWCGIFRKAHKGCVIEIRGVGRKKNALPSSGRRRPVIDTRRQDKAHHKLFMRDVNTVFVRYFANILRSSTEATSAELRVIR